MLQHDRGDRLGDGLDEVDMAAAEDDPDGVEDDVVGDDGAQVVGVGGGAGDGGVDVEQQTLACPALVRVGADLRGRQEIVDEDRVVGRPAPASATRADDRPDEDRAGSPSAALSPPSPGCGIRSRGE